MASNPPKMKLGLSMGGHGYHHSAWLHPEAAQLGPHRFDYYLDITKTAERGLFDVVFLADTTSTEGADVPKGSLGRRALGSFEPLTLLAALAPATSHVGLVATASTTFGTPYQVARQFASIDLLSEGRAGWNLVTSFQDAEAVNYGMDALPDKSRRYERAEEFVDVVAGLWNSFDEGAFPADRETGVYFDPKKLRKLNHAGQHFSVAGPLTVPKSPQVRPVIFQAGASNDGQTLAARTADVVYTAQTTIENAKAFYESLKSRMARFGRDRDQLKIMPGLLPVIGSTEKEAQDKYQAYREMLDPLVGLQYLARSFGDLSGYPLDGPVPELRTDRQLSSRSEVMLEVARRNNYSIRELFQRVAIGNAHNTVVGTPDQIADVMEQWFAEGAADGFNILPAVSPIDVRTFVDEVVPVLQRRGLFRTEYDGTTLRENLGLAPLPGDARLPAQIPSSAAAAVNT